MVNTTTLSAHFGFSSVYPGILVYETLMIAQYKWIHILKALLFLRRMASATTLSARFGFSSVYPGCWVYETPMIA